MPVQTPPYEVHAEGRGSHWVAWITRGGSTTPEGSVLLIAANEKDARERARLWAEQTVY